MAENQQPQMDFDMKLKEDDGINAPSMNFSGTAGETKAEEAPVPQPEASGKKGKKNKPKRTVGQEIVSWILTIVAALAIAFVVRSFIFEPVKVDGESMMTTLQDGEVMVVTKFNYSTLYLELPWGTHKSGEDCTSSKVALFGNPSRFDVVIVRYPKRGDVNFVKRVVGLPGDTVELKEGYLYVNGERYEEPYIEDSYRDSRMSISWNYSAHLVPKKGDVITLKDGVVTLNGEELDSSVIYAGVYDGVNRVIINSGRLFLNDENMPTTADTTITVDQDNYFVMGDHRNNSNDSRSQGAISRDMIVGKVAAVAWPLSAIRSMPNGLDVK